MKHDPAAKRKPPAVITADTLTLTRENCLTEWCGSEISVQVRPGYVAENTAPFYHFETNILGNLHFECIALISA